jgi:hypothetical protein
MDPQRCQPTRAWEAFDHWCPPRMRFDKGPTGREVHDLARADAPHGMEAGLGEEGARRVGTQPPIRHEHVSGLSARIDRLHVREIVGEERSHHQLQEHPSAGMEQPQETGHREAAPRSLRRRLAEGGLEGRGTQAWSSPSHRRERGDGPAIARRPGRMASGGSRAAHFVVKR